MGWIDTMLRNEQPFTVKELYDRFGFTRVIGIGLSGRKAIAGPVCVCSMLLPHDHTISGLLHGNEMTDDQYRELDYLIRRDCIDQWFGWSTPLDTVRQSSYESIMVALRAATDAFSAHNPASVVFIDNFNMDPLPNGLKYAMTPIFSHRKMSSLVDVVSAATIVARSARETMMSIMHKAHPEYGWDTNMGFATQQHIDAIKKYGITVYHRNLNNVKALQNVEVFANLKEAYR